MQRCGSEERGKEMLLQQRGTEKLQSYKCGEKVSGEMMDQWMRGNSSDGSNGKMTGWFWKRGVGCLRSLGLDGGVFLLGAGWEAYMVIAILGNVCPKFLVA